MTPAPVDQALVGRKLRLMRDLLDDLESVGTLDGAQLRQDRLLRHAVERVLTQLVNLAVSVNSHVAVGRLGRAPATYRDSFAAAADCGLLDGDLAAELAATAGLPDILVHEYADIDVDLVAASAVRARTDFAAYVAQASRSLQT